MFIELTINGNKELIPIRSINRVSNNGCLDDETRVIINHDLFFVSESYNDIKRKIVEADKLNGIFDMLYEMLNRMDNGVYIREVIDNPDLPFNGYKIIDSLDSFTEKETH